MEKVTKNIDVDYWVTNDGRTFSLESDAIYHERAMSDYKIKENIKTMKLDFPLFVDVISKEWFFVSDKNEAEYLTRKYAKHSQYIHIKGTKELKLGDWVAVEYGFDDDGRKDEYGLVILAYVLQEMKKFVEKVESVTVDGQF